jgi:hypothetical protein
MPTLRRALAFLSKTEPGRTMQPDDDEPARPLLRRQGFFHYVKLGLRVLQFGLRARPVEKVKHHLREVIVIEEDSKVGLTELGKA